jgi:hypothetical protein
LSAQRDGENQYESLVKRKKWDIWKRFFDFCFYERVV